VLICVRKIKGVTSTLEALPLLLILALAAYLRLAYGAATPGWYTDEGTHVDIAQNLTRGRVQYLAVTQSTLLFGKLPLFELLLAGFFRLLGPGMGSLRLLTGSLGVISTGILYGVVRRTSGRPLLALLSALMYAIYPLAVLYSRFGFSYNLLTPLVWLAFWGLWEYRASQRRRWLALAALAIGLGGISDLWAFSLILPLALLVSTRNGRDLLWSVPLLLLPLGLYAGVMLVTAPGAFLFDLRFTLLRLNQLSLADQVETLALNYTILVSQDHWLALALVGLFGLRPARLARQSLLFTLLPILVLGRTVALHGLSFYYMIPLLPFVGLGVAALLERGLPYAYRATRGGLLGLCHRWVWLSRRPAWRRWEDRILLASSSLVLLAVVGTPFLTSAVWTTKQVRTVFSTDIDPFLLDPADARQAARFVNGRVAPGDLVIASPGLAWLLRAHAADFQMSVAATGQATPHLPADLPPDRFAFDPRYTQARFVILDNLWYNWAVWDVSGVAEMVRQVQTWPLVFQAGRIEVYCNPAGRGCSE